MPPSPLFATSGHARLAYEVAGADGGRDVLLIHAGVNDRRSWRDVIERLAPVHRCTAYDTRGFGETVYEREDGWSPVLDATAVLDAAGVERAVVIASSMGGQAAIDLALAHPDRVVALLLIGPAVRGSPDPEIYSGPTYELNELIEAADAAGDLDEVNRLEAWMWLDGPTAEEGRVGGAARELFLDMNGRALRAPDAGDQAEIPAAWPRLGEIAVPTLILIGRLDAEDVQVVGERAAGLIPNARLRFLDGVAHVPQLEGDPATLDEVSRFVDSLPHASARRSSRSTSSSHSR
jgi:pimeloyl-ACP methyl ester carboxylesterase